MSKTVPCLRVAETVSRDVRGHILLIKEQKRKHLETSDQRNLTKGRIAGRAIFHGSQCNMTVIS